LKASLSPGDVCTLTAAIQSLHACYPGQFLVDVRTSCDAIFENNPYITKLDESGAELVGMHYTDAVNRSDRVPQAFISGYCEFLGRALGVPLELRTNRPSLYVSR
jgi:hypothetical protein